MNQNTVIYLERGFANITHKALMGYLDCSREKTYLCIQRKKNTRTYCIFLCTAGIMQNMVYILMYARILYIKRGIWGSFHVLV